MQKTEEQTRRPLDPHSIHKIETHVQDKINSGYTAPCGWLFRGLTFFFPSSDPANGDGSSDSDSSTSKREDIRLTLARNTAQFGGASDATSLKSSSVTHVMVDTQKVSSAEIRSLRKILAVGSCKKIPHLVSLDWIEESWKHGTLLDEESKFFSNLQHYGSGMLLTLKLQDSRFRNDMLGACQIVLVCSGVDYFFSQKYGCLGRRIQ